MRSTAAHATRASRLTCTAALALVLSATTLTAQAPVAEREGRALRIGIIGAGNMGGPLGVAWARAGHQVVWSSRNPDQLMDLVRDAAPRGAVGYPDAAAFFGDVIVLAVPPNAVEQLGRDYGHLMRGKIVVDITNPRADRDGEEQTARWLAMGTGLAMAQYLPGTRVVKAFNTLSARMLENPAPNGQRIGIPIASDDAEARNVAAALVRDAGFEPVVVGPLARAREFDRGTPVWVSGMTAPQVRQALGLPPGA
jgi:predicted dinucleotide-binding enzyme